MPDTSRLSCRSMTGRHGTTVNSWDFSRRDGAVGVVVAPLGRLLLVLEVTIRSGKIGEIDVTADPERLHGLELAIPAD